MNGSTLRERDGELRQNWYIGCLSRELGRDRPRSTVIYDSPIVLYRDEQGKPVALPDRCLHRHARLSEGTLLPKGRIGCPYHGWVYDREGQVVEVPSEGPSGRCTERGLCLKPYVCVEQDDCIWIWMGENQPDQPHPPFRFPHFSDPAWTSYFMTTDFDNEVTHLAENFMDVPHTVFVHAGWFRDASRKQVPITVETSDGSVLVTYEQPQDRIGFTGKLLNPRNEPMIHTDRFILPNLTRVDYRFGARNSFVIISQCTPVSTLKSRVYTAILYRLGPVGKLMKPFFRFYTRRVIEQDVEIMANQGSSFRFDMTCQFQATDADIVHSEIEALREAARTDAGQAKSRRSLETRTIWI